MERRKELLQAGIYVSAPSGVGLVGAAAALQAGSPWALVLLVGGGLGIFIGILCLLLYFFDGRTRLTLSVEVAVAPHWFDLSGSTPTSVYSRRFLLVPDVRITNRSQTLAANLDLTLVAEFENGESARLPLRLGPGNFEVPTFMNLACPLHIAPGTTAQGLLRFIAPDSVAAGRIPLRSSTLEIRDHQTGTEVQFPLPILGVSI